MQTTIAVFLAVDQAQSVERVVLAFRDCPRASPRHVWAEVIDVQLTINDERARALMQEKMHSGQPKQRRIG